MSDTDLRLEALAEAVVFAHEVDVALPAADATATALERTASLAAAALAGSAPVPEHLRRRLAAAGLAFCAERRQERAAPAAPARPRGFGLPFLVGLAAGALLWALVRAVPQDLEPAARCDRMLAADAAVQRIAWQAGPSPLRGQVEGDVVWSQDRQEGYLRFRGLPPLDAEHRFQLWIVDGTRTGAPVDGGLFAIGNAGAQTVVPVRPALPIGAAKAFVVTVESRHGAVVSQQEHVVAIAGL